jgi:hypothetical protein
MDAEPDPAEQAFEMLRAEVAAMRAELRQLSAAAPKKSLPNYDVTLGEIVRHVAETRRTLSVMSDQPRFDAAARIPGESEMTDGMREAAGQLQARTLELREAAGTVLDRQKLRSWIAGTAAVGVVVGILLCVGMVAVFPRQAGVWAITTIVGGNPWEAGEVLMNHFSPATFERMARLYNACPEDSLTEVCMAAMAVGTIPGNR